MDPNTITEDLLSDVGELLERSLKLANKRIMKPWTRNYIYWKLFGYQRQMDKIHTELGAIVTEFVENMIIQVNLSKVKGVKIQDTKTTNSMDEIFGDASISLKWKYDHLLSIVGAGIDTIAVSTTMTLFFLALNPECQQKAQDEIKLLFDDRNGKELVLSDISELKYVRMCIKEAMRLHAPVPLIGRTTSEDILMGRAKNSEVGISINELHMNPEVFPNPKKYDPERFSESNSNSIKAYTYMPFSVGPRNCIGQKYAECILARVVAQILRHFSVKTYQKAEDIKILYEIAGTPYPNVELVFDKRMYKQ